MKLYFIVYVHWNDAMRPAVKVFRNKAKWEKAVMDSTKIVGETKGYRDAFYYETDVTE